MKVVEQGQVGYTERAFDQDAASAMRGRVERALVELITNSDDSYARLEEKGRHGRGVIRIEIERRRGQSKSWRIIVRDRAEGMTIEEMKEKLCQAGALTSGFEKGTSVRGLLGRGAKDVAAFGEVEFESIKGEMYYKCRLDPRGRYELIEPTPATKDIRENLRISRGTGTVVTIEVDPKYDAPRHTTLVEKLPSYFALRDIASDSNRELVLFNLNDPKHNGDPLIYKYPEGKLVLEDEFQIPDYSEAKAKLRIYRARERFVEDPRSPYRQCGILVKSKRAIHEITLFGLENEPYAEWFFGKLECPYVDELIKEYDRYFAERAAPPASNPMRLLSRQRDGLVREHPFLAGLFDAAGGRLRALVEEERRKDEERRATVENEETAKALRKLASAASKFLQGKLRQFEIEAVGRADAAKFEGEFAIIPPASVMQPGESKYFSVFAKEELTLRAGIVVNLVLEGEGVDLDEREVRLSSRPDRSEIYSGTFRVVARTAGALCLVRAALGGVTSETAIQVEEREPPPVPHGLSFEHNSYHIRFGKTKRLLVRARVAQEDLDGVAVKVATTSSDVLPLTTLVTLKKNVALDCFTATVLVTGKKVGGKAKIIAQLRGYLAETNAIIVQQDLTGPFSFEIKFENEDFGLQRAVWAEQNTVLRISVKHKSLARYLGPEERHFPGQDQAHFKAIVAEIVADQVVRRLIELREEKLGPEPDIDAHAVYATHQKYVGEFLPIAHEMQLPTAKLRRL